MSTPSYMKADRAPFPWRVVLVILLLLLLIGGVFLVRYALFVREAAAERSLLNQYGVPALMGPLHPGGPLYGQGDLADLVVTDKGWNQEDLPGGGTKNTIFITVHNKSGRTWDHVEVVVDLSGDAGSAGTERQAAGTLAPGQDATVNFPDFGPSVNDFQVAGIDGQ